MMQARLAGWLAGWMDGWMAGWHPGNGSCPHSSPTPACARALSVCACLSFCVRYMQEAADAYLCPTCGVEFPKSRSSTKEQRGGGGETGASFVVPVPHDPVADAVARSFAYSPDLGPDVDRVDGRVTASFA